MTKENLSPAEVYAIQLDNGEPGYFAQIPAILYHCTYIEKDEAGNQVRKKLRPITIALYGAIKQIAGNEGACWTNRDNLAEMLGCSAGAISNAKKELTQPIEQLGGKSLITVIQKKKRHHNSKGAATYHHITVNLIWAENNAFMSTLKFQPKPSLGLIKSVYTPGAPSNSDIAKAAPSNSDIASPGAPSYSDTNNRTQKKKHPVTEEEAAAPAASGCLCGDPVSVKQEHEQLSAYAEQQMRKFGCDDNFVREMMRRFTPTQIIQGGKYTAKQLKRQEIGNKYGYLRNAIEQNRSWDDEKA